MKNLPSFLFCVFTLIIANGCGSASKSIETQSPQAAGLPFKYSDLALKDLDQMNSLIKNKIADSRKLVGIRTGPLLEALQIVYSRPNPDGLIDKVISPLKGELIELDQLEPTYEKMIDESLAALQNSKDLAGDVQVTHWVLLENIISDMKPKKKEEFENRILEKIFQAKIEISREALDERKLRVMKKSQSPSVLAAKVLGKKIED